MNSFVLLLLLTFLGSVAGLIGGVIFLWQKSFAKSLALHAIPFAAGTMITVAFLDLLPEAVEALDEKAYLFVLITFVTVFLIEQYLLNIHHHENEEDNHLKSAIPLVIFGDTIHNFLDGVAIAGSFLIDPKLGLFVAIATFLHETPHEVGDFGILLSAGWKKVNIFLVNFLSSLTTFAGAMLVYFFSPQIVGMEGYLVAIACGIFLHVAIVDFLPEVRKVKDEPWHQTLAFVLGIVTIIIVGNLIPH